MQHCSWWALRASTDGGPSRSKSTCRHPPHLEYFPCENVTGFYAKGTRHTWRTHGMRHMDSEMRPPSRAHVEVGGPQCSRGADRVRRRTTNHHRCQALASCKPGSGDLGATPPQPNTLELPGSPMLPPPPNAKPPGCSLHYSVTYPPPSTSSPSRMDIGYRSILTILTTLN